MLGSQSCEFLLSRTLLVFAAIFGSAPKVGGAIITSAGVPAEFAIRASYANSIRVTLRLNFSFSFAGPRNAADSPNNCLASSIRRLA